MTTHDERPQAPTRQKRPSLEARKSSNSSHVSQSPLGEGRSPSHRSLHKPQRHVVGVSRMGSRTRSYGKNLNALTGKVVPAPKGDGDVLEVKAHRRVLSGGSDNVSADSPQQENDGIVRNASAVLLAREGSNVELKKNLSSGQLRRDMSSGQSQRDLSSGQLKRDLSSGQLKRDLSSGHLKRDLSNGQLQKNLSSGQLKKNLSSGQLMRVGSGKNVAKLGKGHPSARRALSNPLKAAKVADVPRPTVRFALGGGEGKGNDEEFEAIEGIEGVEGIDDGWTEDSASQSPNTTRSNTRQNSVILDSGQVQNSHKEEKKLENRPRERPSTPELQATPSDAPELQLSPRVPRPNTELSAANDENLAVPKSNLSQSQQPARILSLGDTITARLLQRHPQHHAAPQVSSISASVHGRTVLRSRSGNVLDLRASQPLGTSQGSTLRASTSGPDLVSRFIGKGASVEGTPAESKYLLHQTNTEVTAAINNDLHAGNEEASTREDGETAKNLDASKRNKSTPNMTTTAASSTAQNNQSFTTSLYESAGGRRSGSSTPGRAIASGLNRAEQKLMLQRASSALESGMNVPAVLPLNNKAAKSLGPVSSLAVMGGLDGRKGRLDPRTRRGIDEVERQYAVIRRFRNPVADAIVRVRMFSGAGNGVAVVKGKGPRGAPAKSALVNGGSSGSAGKNGAGGQYGLSQSLKEGRAASAKGKRKVSFEAPKGSRDDAEMDEEEYDRGRGQSRAAGRTEVEEICRRIWEGYGIDGLDAGQER